MSKNEILREEDGGKGRYVLCTDGGEAFLSYTLPRPGEIVADHTFVPPEMRGTGAGKALVARLVDDARTEGMKIIPTCWFVKDESEKHPEWSDVFAA